MELIGTDSVLRVASPDTIPEGERNDTLTQTAGRMRLVLPQAEGIAPALHAINHAGPETRPDF